jgi:hypothetical protein
MINISAIIAVSGAEVFVGELVGDEEIFGAVLMLAIVCLLLEILSDR